MGRAGRRRKGVRCGPRSVACGATDPRTRLQDLCLPCGVVLAFVPHLPKTYVNEATRWIAPGMVMIEGSVRHPYADVVWFNLFHELGHILLHGKRRMYVNEH